jgi:hypothetical protein
MVCDAPDCRLAGSPSAFGSKTYTGLEPASSFLPQFPHKGLCGGMPLLQGSNIPRHGYEPEKIYLPLLVPDYKQQDQVYLMPQLHLCHPAKLQEKHATNNL